jgi:hypothetical protein
MKYLPGVLFTFLILSSTASAYDLFVTEVSEPFEVIEMSLGIEDKQAHLGKLNDFPVMYEFEVEDKVILKTSLRQEYTEKPISFGLIVVRKDDFRGGVTEVLRFNPTTEDWMIMKDKSIGITFLDSEEISYELESGIYRIEVSTPENIGSYVLNFGEFSQKLNYGEKLSRARITQKHFGYTVLKMLTLQIVFYPLGIVFLSLLIYKTRKYRKLISNGS